MESGQNADYYQKLTEMVRGKLKFSNDKRARNAWSVYQPSEQTGLLQSECGRTVYSEAFEFADHKEIDSLKMIALKVILEAYSCGAVSHTIQLSDHVWFGENLNISMPIEDIVLLDNEYFWKRVVLAKCKNKHMVEEMIKDVNVQWKNRGIECKFTEVLEYTAPEAWDVAKFINLAKTVSPYVYQLDIRQLQPIPQVFVEKNRYNRLYKICNYPPLDCHHGNLGATIAELEHLTVLSLQFGVERLNCNYHQRIFEVSYRDIQQLADGLARRHQLKQITIRHTRLDDRKLKMLIRSLVDCPLFSLELPYCMLENHSGKTLAHYLLQSKGTLERLELKGNRLSEEGLLALGYGLRRYKGQLDYLGLAQNPIGVQGIVAIGGGFNETRQVRKLSLSGCSVDGKEGAFRVAQILGFHEQLEWLDITAIPLGLKGGDKLLENLMEHRNLTHLECRCCELTENQQRKLKILILRNIYFKENQCLLKDYFTELDAIEIDAWIAEVKQPNLKAVLTRNLSRDSFDMNGKQQVSQISGGLVPTFIPVHQRKVASNSQLLNTYYTDCFGTDSDIRLYNPEDDGDIPVEVQSLEDNASFDPNSFDQTQFLQSALLGKCIDLTAKHYFQ